MNIVNLLAEAELKIETKYSPVSFAIEAWHPMTAKEKKIVVQAAQDVSL